MHYCDFEGLWEKGFSLLSDIESEIGEKMPFAYSPNFGYLTANPANCGTGLRVSIYLHIPALIHMKQLESAISNEKEDGVLFTSMLGDIQNLAGDVLVLQNRYSLGTDEKSILRELHTAAMKFIGAEKLLRTHSKEKNLPEMMDLVSRAFGLLTHSYQLEIKECLEALSLLKLGIDLGWINGVTQKTIDGLFFSCRKAHLLFHLKENKKFDAAQIPHIRAAFIHEKLSKMKLLIES
jgi:protein arginine kinase